MSKQESIIAKSLRAWIKHERHLYTIEEKNTAKELGRLIACQTIESFTVYLADRMQETESNFDRKAFLYSCGLNENGGLLE